MTEPIHATLVREFAAREARTLVHTGLRYCRTCQAAASLPCRTVSGATARRSHAGRCA